MSRTVDSQTVITQTSKSILKLKKLFVKLLLFPNCLSSNTSLKDHVNLVSYHAATQKIFMGKTVHFTMEGVTLSIIVDV